MISKLLFIIGIACLCMYGFVTVQAYFHQIELEEELDQAVAARASMPAPAPLPNSRPPARKPPPRKLKEGDLFGRLEIPRLSLSVMVMEGDHDKVLRLGAGHIPGTSLAIAGHRDSFFRPLKDIKVNDTIRFTTPEGMNEYRVVSTKIVGPRDTFVLENKPEDTLMLVTCYPFYFVGPAPDRFIVEAARK